MKKTLFALLAGSLFLVLTAGDCKKSSTEPTSTAPKVPLITFSAPGTQDQCSQQANLYVQIANALSAEFAVFSSLQPINNGNDYTWSVTVDSLTITVKATRQGNGSFTWEIKYNGVDEGTVYSNKVVASGSTTSADGKNGSISIYDDASAGVVATFTWSTSASNVLTGTLIENASPGGSPAYKVDIISNSNGSGEVSTYTWGGSAWPTTPDFHATWTTNGGQATCG